MSEQTQENRISSFWFIIEPILIILKIKYQPALEGVRSLANYSVAYEETLSNRVSDFRYFVCSLFTKAILLDFY